MRAHSPRLAAGSSERIGIVTLHIEAPRSLLAGSFNIMSQTYFLADLTISSAK